MSAATPREPHPLSELADRIDRGAAELRADTADTAADTAAAYAARLREQVASGQPATDAQIQQAEKVADAAELGGILIDGRPLAEAAATADNAHVWYPADKQAWEDGTHPAQTKAAAVEESGQFTHVAEPGQVPFWQLGHVDQQHDTDEA